MKNQYTSTTYARNYGSAEILEITHNLDADFPVVQIWDSSTRLLINPISVESQDSNTLTVVLPYTIIPYVRVIK
jgi:hypothetical protein